ncbi:BA14K family protein [Mesorhizobium sp. M0761]|uniref:BA14K family protein n=1 Tax=Mesorhizobium sp. M0761 TaxID=2956994 RepID=UPI003335DA15
MSSLFSSTVKSGLLALGLFSGLTAPSAAGPILQPDLSVPASTALSDITPVRDSWAGGNDRRSFNDWQWRRHDGRRFARSGNWKNGNWNGGNWNGGDNWRWRHHRHHRGRDFDTGAAAVLGLGLGLGLGSIYNNGYYNNGYYNDGYYVQPAPRRYYRTQRLSSAHVQWCYDRYRSYRAWDNTFQPYGGPRQQCWSPYS